MARQKLTAKQRKKKEKRQKLLAERVVETHSDEWWNGGGFKPWNIKCENCQYVMPLGEQYGLHTCPRCGGYTATYEPQLADIL